MTDEQSLIVHEKNITIAQAADAVASRHAFDAYRSKKSKQTLRAHDVDLQRFDTYLREVGVVVGKDFGTEPEAWSHITWGLIAGFVQWMLANSYAVNSISRALSTVKRYSEVAAQAGYIKPEALALIRTVRGHSQKEGLHLDEHRESANVATRTGKKKAQHTSITDEQAHRLMTDHPDTPQGRRDAMMMCILLQMGLRVGELVILRTRNIIRNRTYLRFYRPKVHKEQLHKIPRMTREALVKYFDNDAPADDFLLRASDKHGNLTHEGMTVSAVNQYVRQLGIVNDLPTLSPHDCRHYWATKAASSGTDLFALQEAGGWNSLAMPRRYIEQAKVANQGIKGFED